MIDITKLSVDHGQALEVVPNVEFVGHAHAAMQLNRLLSNETTGLTDLNFGT